MWPALTTGTTTTSSRPRLARAARRDRGVRGPGPGSEPYRAFVWMQGHNYANFAQPQIQTMLLRGIAWAGKRPVDALMTERPRPTPGGQRDSRSR